LYFVSILLSWLVYLKKNRARKRAELNPWGVGKYSAQQPWRWASCCPRRCAARGGARTLRHLHLPPVRARGLWFGVRDSETPHAESDQVCRILLHETRVPNPESRRSAGRAPSTT